MTTLAASSAQAQAGRKPVVSVILACYNCEAFIDDAIRSLQAQQYADWEAIAVDDGSRDGTLARLQALAQHEPRLRVLSQANSGGPAGPRNRALAEARGEFLTFLDPDDYYLPDKLQRQVAALQQHPAASLVFSDCEIIDEHGRRLGERYLARVNYLARARPFLKPLGDALYLAGEDFYAFSSADIAGPHIGLMLRRTALQAEQEWFAADLVVGEDLDLWFRLMQKAPVLFIDDALYCYRQHSGSLMHDNARALRGSLDTHLRNFQRAQARLNPAQTRQYRRRIAQMAFHLGYQLRCSGNPRAARAHYLAALRWQPSLRTLLAILKSLIPARRGAPDA